MRVGGPLVFYWFDGGRLETRFTRLVDAKEVAFDFAGEMVRFELMEERGGTRVKISHACADKDAVHVAQAWGFLKSNLKAFLEFGVDLRDGNPS